MQILCGFQDGTRPKTGLKCRFRGALASCEPDPWALETFRKRPSGYHQNMTSTLSPTRVVSFEEARHIVEQHSANVHAGEVESVDLVAARGRVLAQPLLADRDFPPFPRAARDGYAVLAADVAQVPTQLEVTGEIRAGEAQKLSVGKGQAVSIMTGAPLPAGADAVVMVEYTRSSGKSVEI